MDRPIRVRTDASADTFWSRVRTSNEYSPDFQVIPEAERIQRLTPFGRQNRPRLNPTPHVPSQQLPMMSSRSVERMELRKGIRDAEMDKENVMRANHRECASAPHAAKKLTSSRSVERVVMQSALCDQEETAALVLIEENALLKRRIAHLEENLERALRINHALTHDMLKKW